MQPPKKNCETCAHVGVCIIYRTFAQAHTQLFPPDSKIPAAFAVGDLATICKPYLSKAITDNIQALEQRQEAEPTEEE